MTFNLEQIGERIQDRILTEERKESIVEDSVFPSIIVSNTQYDAICQEMCEFTDIVADVVEWDRLVLSGVEFKIRKTPFEHMVPVVVVKFSDGWYGQMNFHETTLLKFKP